MSVAGVLAAVGWLAVVGLAAVATRRRAVAAELVARAAHELRGPLQAAMLAVHAAERRGGSGAAALSAVAAELERARLALADLTLAGSGRTAGDRSSEVELGRLLERHAEGWRSLAASRGRRLRLQADGAASARVLADGTRVAQAVGNLVANAVEHGEGTVTVSVGAPAGAAPGGAVAIEVRDEGRGLAEPLDVLIARRRAGRGRRGRGLAITAAVAARHGGQLVAGPPADGTRLWLELPAAGPRAEARR